MSSAEVFLLAPLLVWLAGGLLVLLLEAVGTPIGARKTGPRTHLAVVALLVPAGAVVQLFSSLSESSKAEHAFGGAMVFDGLTVVAQLGGAALVFFAAVAAVSRLRELQADHGDSYALLLGLGAAHAVAVSTDDLIVLGGALLLASMATAAMASLDRVSARGAEAAIKETKTAGVSFALLSFAAALAYAATGNTTLSSLAGAEPALLVAAALTFVVVLGRGLTSLVNMAQLDVAQGAPPFAGGLSAALSILTAAVVLSRCAKVLELAPPALNNVVVGLAVISLVLPGILALDQRVVPRVFAHLLACGAAPVLASAIVGTVGDTIFSGLVAAASGVAALVGLGIFLRPGGSTPTWERFSGLGRTHPYFALAILWMLATLVGFPGTAGFTARLFIARHAFGADAPLLGAAVLGSIAIGAAPVLRFGIMMFARTPERTLAIQQTPWRTAAFVIGSGVLLAAAVGSSAAHEVLVRALR